MTDNHLLQIKSNVGHSEPAAGISGLMKAIMSIERGMIPGNPTFIKPSPKSTLFMLMFSQEPSLFFLPQSILLAIK